MSKITLITLYIGLSPHDNLEKTLLGGLLTLITLYIGLSPPRKRGKFMGWWIIIISYYPLYRVISTIQHRHRIQHQHWILLPSISGYLHNSIFNTSCSYHNILFPDFNYFY